MTPYNPGFTGSIPGLCDSHVYSYLQKNTFWDDKPRKRMIMLQKPNSICIPKFSFKYLYRVSQQIKIVHVQ